VENLYVDDDRNLWFVDVVTSGVLGLRKKHHLVPAEAIAEESPGDITLRVNQETLEGAPPSSDAHAGPDDELQRAAREQAFSMSGGKLRRTPPH
jgi:hypothetical protein